MNFPSEPYNMANELAKERNRAAAERTLMAWIRTSLSLISFGFGIDRIIAAMRGAFNNPVDPLHLSHLLGLSFIIIGTLVNHLQNLKRIASGNFTYNARLSLSFVVAIALIGVGIFAFLGILIKGG